MIRWNHDIYHELPEYKEKIDQLIGQDPHFSTLIDRYNDITQRVDGMNRHVNATDALDLYSLKRQRLLIKDSLFTQLRTT